MKELQFDKIMKEHYTNTRSEIDIESLVMNRIEKYEKQKSERIIYWQHLFSALAMFSGVVLIFLVQYFSNILNSNLANTWYQLYLSVSAWTLTFILASITLTIAALFLFTSVFKIKTA